MGAWSRERCGAERWRGTRPVICQAREAVD